MRFAMGAAMLVRKEVFERAGGFRHLADHLADDFILGKSIQEAGYRLEIAEPVVESLPDVGGGRECLRHQIRWARTIRICQPAGYLGSILLQGFSLLTLKMLLFGPDKFTVFLSLGILAAKALANVAIRVLRSAIAKPNPRYGFCRSASGSYSSHGSRDCA